MRSPRLRQNAVLWAVADYDEQGYPTVSAATQINCRWEDGRQEVVNADGTITAADAEVWVNRSIDVGSILWKGAGPICPTVPAT